MNRLVALVRIQARRRCLFLQRQAPGAQVAGPCVSSAPGELTCLVPRSHRKAGLQPLLHAAVREDDPQTSDAKWARGSRSQTHRRAAKGGFTQDDRNVRGLAPTHTILSFFGRFARVAANRPNPILLYNWVLDTDTGTGPIPSITVSGVNAYSGGVLARALPEGLRYLST